MIESKIIELLNSLMPYPAYGQIPDTLPDQFAVIRLIAHSRRNMIDAATVNIHCYAKTKAQAEVYADEVKNIVLGMNSLSEVSSVKIGGLEARNDTAFGLPRYELTVNVWYYS